MPVSCNVGLSAGVAKRAVVPKWHALVAFGTELSPSAFDGACLAHIIQILDKLVRSGA
jgi:hypothetical protein